MDVAEAYDDLCLMRARATARTRGARRERSEAATVPGSCTSLEGKVRGWLLSAGQLAGLSEARKVVAVPPARLPRQSKSGQDGGEGSGQRPAFAALDRRWSRGGFV